MAIKKKTSFNQLMAEWDTIKKDLKEAYIFDDDMGGGEGMPPQEGEGMGMPQDGMGMQQQPQGNSEGDSEEEKALHMQQVAQHEPIIMKMREIALEGLQKYADQPFSPLYTFFRDAFLDTDKVLTDGSNKKK